MQRLPFVDWARGFAVVAMVLWHTGDGWLRPGLKAGEGFFFLRFIGGLAAPSFLLLAGVAAALAARPTSDPERAQKTFRGSFARGFEVWILGYVLRLQTWLVDAGAIRYLETYRAWLPLLAGYALAVYGARCLAATARRSLALMLAAAALVAIALVQVEEVAPGRLQRLLAVDVLQAIGASLMVIALLERTLGLLQRPLWLLLLALLVVLATEPLAAQLPGSLPVPLAAYLGRIRVPRGTPNPSLFPLFPWLAYALFGAGFGACLRLFPERRERIVVLGLTLGSALALITSEAQPALHALIHALPSSVPLVRTCFRAGIVLLLMGIGYAFPTGFVAARLVDVGRASLRIYWVHLLFAYGIFARPLRARLDYGGWLSLVLPLLVAMWGLSRLGASRKRAPVRA